jgi:ATP-dependent RNA helicase RhlE
MSFETFGLHESLLKVLPEIGYADPTPIQMQAIPLVMTGKDLLGSAQTGTGKTAAFLLPILHRLLAEPAKGTQVLVLEPTRELALQVEEQAKVFSKYTELRSACVYGGVAFGPQEKAFADGVEVIAATPGRLLDHLRQGNARFDKLRVLVLDEVDRMLDMGFLPDVRSILRQLPETRQTLFFSATVPSEIGRLADNMLKDPGKVAIAPNRKTAEGITQQIHPVPEHLKAKLLEKILSHEHVSSALVFTRTKQGADKVCAVIERNGMPVSRIHGDLSQGQRLKALEQFKSGEVKFLVATDIAARGLDVDGISHVINYDLPDSPDDYVHRIGRTARAGETGHAISLFSPRDAAALSAIEKHLSQKIEKVIMPNFDYEETLGVQHEVRQGHNVRDYDDLGRPGAGPSRPRPFKDEDERAKLTVLFSPEQDPADASAAPEPRLSRGGGDGDGDGRGRRRGRGGRDSGRSSGGSGRERRPDRELRPPREAEARREGSGPGFGRDRGTASRDRHQSNATLTATDVLRKASDQKAVVGSDMMELRPRSDAPDGADESEDASPDALAPVGVNGEGGGKKRKRRRRRGKGGAGGDGSAVAGAAQQPRQGQPQQAGPRRDGQRPGGGRDGQRREGRGDGRRDGRRDRFEERGSSGASKPSLWQRLKSSLGIGSGSSGSLGDKW